MNLNINTRVEVVLTEDGAKHLLDYQKSLGLPAKYGYRLDL